jgi:hypothetical protein
VADLLRQNSLELGAIGGGAVPAERGVGHVGSRGLGVAENVGPLLDLLPEVLGVEGGVTDSQISISIQDDVILQDIRGTVPDLHLWAIASVPWVPIADLITPLLSSFDELTLSALRVPESRASEAPIRHTREGRAALEEVRVCSHKNLK